MVYFDRALTWTTRKLVSHFKATTEDVQFDTVIGTGLSGTIFAARVADTMGVQFGIIRKPDDDSTHSSNRLEGAVGDHWLFVDDFMETGDTFKRVMEAMTEDHPGSRFAGAYLYEADSRSYLSPEYLTEKYGQWVKECTLGPLNGPQTAEYYAGEYPYQPDLSWPPGGFEDRVKHLVPLPADLEVSYNDDEGNPTFWSQTAYSTFSIRYYPQLEPIIKAFKAALDSDGAYYKNRRLRDIPEMAACVALLHSK